MNLKLRKCREEMGLTQRQFAKKIGKSVGTIQAWEGGLSYPNAEAIWDMCVLFGTDPSEFVGWWDEHPRTTEQTSGLTREESLLVGKYRTLDRRRRDSVYDTVDALADKAQAQEVGSPSSSEGAA